MDDRTRVEWREWGEAAFAEATERASPLLLSLTATWCDHCHEMEQATYAVPTVAANVNDRVVPVRVDVDRQPRVRDRYTVGGFPSTVFLAPDASLLHGAGYLGPDALRETLESVCSNWQAALGEVDAGSLPSGRIPPTLSEDDPPRGELSREIEVRMLAQLREHADPVDGGWGRGPKFALPGALEFALKRDRELALRSFDALQANLFDEREGGFYRYASESDWTGVHTEKLLDENAALVRAFSNAYCASGREKYRERAKQTIEYLTTTLWVGERLADADDVTRLEGAFAASQAPTPSSLEPGGNDEKALLEGSDQPTVDPPTTGAPVDRTIFVGANALAVDALLTYYAYTDDERARAFAEAALAYCREHALDDGAVCHYCDVESGEAEASDLGDVGVSDPDDVGVSDPDDASPSLSSEPTRGGEWCLLVNQARMLAALTTAASVLGGAEYVVEARRLAERTIDRLRVGSSFVDGLDGVGLVSRTLRPIDGNVELADALIDLSILTGEDRYRRVATDTLADFAGASARFGPPVASYASAVSRVLESPLVVRVADEPRSPLHRAALRIADHDSVVVCHDPCAAGGSDTFSLDPGTARLECGEFVSAPAKTPAELSDRVSAVPELDT